MAQVNSVSSVDGDRGVDQVFKMLVIGDSNVGKTTLLTRFCEDRFQSTFMSTVGIDYKTKVITLDDERVKLQIWDTAGQERFRTLTNAYFRGAVGAVLLYDITSRSSYVNCSTWMESVAQHASNSISIVIVGHKCDAEPERAVMTEEGRRLAEHYEALFFEASSITGQNVSKIFIRLSQEIKSNQERAIYQKRNGRTTAGHDNSKLRLKQMNETKHNAQCHCSLP